MRPLTLLVVAIAGWVQRDQQAAIVDVLDENRVPKARLCGRKLRLTDDGCLRCLLLVMCTHPFAKEALTLHLARSEGHERYFGCNLMHRNVLASESSPFLVETLHGSRLSDLLLRYG